MPTSHVSTSHVPTTQSRTYVHNRAERIHEDFDHRREALRDRLQDQDFLANKGIGNEIGFYTFCYDPSLEFECRAFIRELQREAAAGELPCTLKVVNLYDALIGIAEKRRILRAIPRRELKTGSKAQLDELQKPCSPKAFAEYLLEQTSPQNPGDVIILTGVGEVYPVLRVHESGHVRRRPKGAAQGKLARLPVSQQDRCDGREARDRERSVRCLLRDGGGACLDR